MPSGHVDPTKLRDLTPHAWSVLARLDSGPIPRYQINPGVIERLGRESLIVETVGTGANRGKRFISITQAGRDKLAERRS